jgi:hypothetical protein
MLEILKNLLTRYDKWCQSAGLTPDQKRCCVPIKVEDIVKNDGNKDAEGEAASK